MIFRSSPITLKTIRDAEWKPVYNYIGPTTGFTTFASDGLMGMTITKDKRGSKVIRTTYTILSSGRKTESPSQAVRLYNAEVKKHAGQRPAPAGSPKSAVGA